MSTPAPVVQPAAALAPDPHPVPVPIAPEGSSRNSHAPTHFHLPTVPEAFASLLRTLVVALFLLTFVLQPFLIPSESMEHTLLVGDFLLVNKQIFAPSGQAGSLTRAILPYREVQRGDIVVFHHPNPPLLIKRVVGIPGDRIRVENGRVVVNDAPVNEPYAAFEPAGFNPFRDHFPARIYTDPLINPDWWREMQNLTRNGDLVVPQSMYFVLGDNRNHSDDSRYWGLVPRQAIVARPVVIYFSLRRPSTTDVQLAADDRLDERQLTARLASIARWKRIFQVVH